MTCFPSVDLKESFNGRLPIVFLGGRGRGSSSDYELSSRWSQVFDGYRAEIIIEILVIDRLPPGGTV